MIWSNDFQLASAFNTWIHDKGSMTARMRTVCRQVDIHVMRQSRQPVLTTEADYLGLPQSTSESKSESSTALIREVIMICDGQPWLFARTVVPQQSLPTYEMAVISLGTTHLGSILFSDPTVSRTHFQYSYLHPKDPYRKWAQQNATDSLLARRSQFVKNNNPLLLTEVFLPAMQTALGEKI